MTAVLPRWPDLPGTSPGQAATDMPPLRQSSQKWGSDRQGEYENMTLLSVKRMGAEYPVTLCDLGILADQAAEPVPP
jgi:hypothetical protein